MIDSVQCTTAELVNKESAATPASRDEDHEKLDSPTHTTDEEAVVNPAVRPEAVLHRWNESRVNTFRFLTTLYSFIIMGMSDGAVGVRRFSPKITMGSISRY
jgi:hypothetical protein